VFGGGSLVLAGTVGALVFAYVVRFLAVAFLPVEAGLEKIGDTLTSASRTLGASPLRTLLRIELPLLRGSLVAAATLVVIDVLKELPLTLILRPFNLDTLATRSFQLATDEQVAQSAPAALIIIASASIVVVLLHRTLDRTPSSP
jgi:iron(III) transport system permease protein